MTPIQFAGEEGKGLKVLCLGAHCDDIEIGCGGSILKLINAGLVQELQWIVFASNPVRKKEAERCAGLFLEGLENQKVTVLNYRDAFLNFSALEIKEYFESVKGAFAPDLIFTHYRNDRHQDHRLISDLTWNTFRNHLILEYEIPKYDGDLGIPNCFIQLTETLAEKKIKFLLEGFPSEKNKHWFDRETFLALMRIRGLESANNHKYAEAFHARKLII
ncbi:MAG: PIG-L deacetylase family protein [Aurantibacter sp.]